MLRWVLHINNHPVTHYESEDLAERDKQHLLRVLGNKCPAIVIRPLTLQWVG